MKRDYKSVFAAVLAALMMFAVLSVSELTIGINKAENNTYEQYVSVTEGYNVHDYIGYSYDSMNGDKIRACPASGASFEGFYDDRGGLIAKGEWNEAYKAYEAYVDELSSDITGTIIARFTEGKAVLGDIDGNGIVNTNDAVTTMRFAISIVEGISMNTDAADMNGDGRVTLDDAIITLRIALGLEL